MEQNYAFKSRIFSVHEKNRKNDGVWPGIEGTVVDDGWRIVADPALGPVVRNAALDLCDYFRVSMGVYPHLCARADTAAKTLIYEVDPAVPGYRLEVGADHVVIRGGTDRMAAQGSYALEEQMNLSQGPVLRRGVTGREPLFSPRMTHSGYELDKFPNEHLLQIAHAGMDAILVFVDGMNLSFNGYNDFNELIARASAFGLDVYAYSHLVSELHPDDPAARDFYDGLYGRLFAQCPGFKGVVMVGESIEFLSKDERTQPHLMKDLDLNDPRPLPCGFPCRDYPQWVTLLRDIIRARRADAKFIFWTYNWGYCPADVRLALIDSLPTDITLLVTYEMFEKLYPAPGVAMPCTDYTLLFIGPGYYFATEAEAARRRGIELYTISNTGGMTWDIGDVPYIPAPLLWHDRCVSLRGSREKWGLSGLMESHHYGWTASFLSELIKNEFWSGGPSFDEYFAALLARDYGAENVADMMEVWRLMSEGFTHIVATVEDQWGPLRTGPSYPLLLGQAVDFPYKPYGAHVDNAPIFNPAYHTSVYVSEEDVGQPAGTGPDAVRSDHTIVYHIKTLDRMAELCDRACGIFRTVLERMDAHKKEKALDVYGLCKFCANTAKTCANVKKWHILRCVLWGLNGEFVVPYNRSRKNILSYKALQPGQTLDRDVLLGAVAGYLPHGVGASDDEIRAAMITVAGEEIQNAGETLPLVERDSRLGWEPTMEYVCDGDCIRWKIALTRDSMERILNPDRQGP